MKKEKIDYNIILTAGLILFVVWMVYNVFFIPSNFYYLKFLLTNHWQFYAFEFIPAIFSFIMGVSLVLIHKRKMQLNAALAGLAVLMLYLYFQSLHYPIINIKQIGDLIYLGGLILVLPVAAFLGAYVAAKMKNIE